MLCIYMRGGEVPFTTCAYETTQYWIKRYGERLTDIESTLGSDERWQALSDDGKRAVGRCSSRRIERRQYVRERRHVYVRAASA